MIWFIAHHGTRNFTSKNSQKMVKALDKIRKSVINRYEKGQIKISNDTANLLKEWKLSFVEGLFGDEETDRVEFSIADSILTVFHKTSLNLGIIPFL